MSNVPFVHGIAVLMTVVIISVMVGCGGDTNATPESAAPSIRPSSTRPPTCVVRLHGKGGDGEPTRVVGDVTELSPSGNAEGWGARQWVYDADEQYAQATAIVADALDDADCTPSGRQRLLERRGVRGCDVLRRGALRWPRCRVRHRRSSTGPGRARLRSGRAG